MRKFQCLPFVLNSSYICCYIIYMTAPLRMARFFVPFPETLSNDVVFGCLTAHSRQGSTYIPNKAFIIFWSQFKIVKKLWTIFFVILNCLIPCLKLKKAFLLKETCHLVVFIKINQVQLLKELRLSKHLHQYSSHSSGCRRV